MPLPIAPTKRYLYHMKVNRPIMPEEELRRLPMTIYGMGPGRGAHSRPDGPQLIVAWAHATPPEPDFSDEDQDRIEQGYSHEHGLENYGYAILAEMELFAPELANCGGLAGTSCGYYGVTPDANPLIGFDAQQENLLHAAGFSGHGLMHAPITAVLVEALLAGDARRGWSSCLRPSSNIPSRCRPSIPSATSAPVTPSPWYVSNQASKPFTELIGVKPYGPSRELRAYREWALATVFLTMGCADHSRCRPIWP